MNRTRSCSPNFLPPPVPDTHRASKQFLQPTPISVPPSCQFPADPADEISRETYYDLSPTLLTLREFPLLSAATIVGSSKTFTAFGNAIRLSSLPYVKRLTSHGRLQFPCPSPMTDKTVAGAFRQTHDFPGLEDAQRQLPTPPSFLGPGPFSKDRPGRPPRGSDVKLTDSARAYPPP